MKDINKAIIVGRLGANPILRHTKNGIAVTHFSVATTRRIVKEDQKTESKGEPKGESGTELKVEMETPRAPIAQDLVTAEETQWHRIVTWGRQAEICAQYLKKGNTVYVEGSIRSHQYEDKTGQNRTSFEIQSENVVFLGGRKPETNESEAPVHSAVVEVV